VRAICHPRTGERLKPEHGRTKVAAFDLTFSAPKSVSVLLRSVTRPWRQAISRGLFEIEGAAAPVLRDFSRRRIEIEERAP
jgi:hypothetical protein